jgi:hypothetical protein
MFTLELQLGFEAQTWKPPAGSWGPNHQTPSRRVCAMPPLRSRHMSPSSSTAWSPSRLAPVLDLVNYRPELVNMVHSFSCDLACWCPQVSATHSQSSGHLGPSFQASLCPPPLPVHKHGTSLLDLLHPRHSSLCSTHLHASTAKGHVAHTLMPWLVSKLNQSRSSLDNHSSQLDTQGHVSTLCSQTPYQFCQDNMLLHSNLQTK